MAENAAPVTVAGRALELVHDGDVVGLGTGSAATAFLYALAERVNAGLRVRGVPTSRATAELATRLRVPLVTLEEVMPIDVTVDGADEVDPRLDLIKGYGGALVREKIVAAASRRLVILVGAEKLVAILGARGVLPVEIVPFGLALCRSRLLELGYGPALRTVGGRPFVTDNGNHILDCTVSPISDPLEVERALLAIPGVVGTGLFIGMAHAVLVQDGATVSIRERR
jgi:ribose 5-phosphate isomerase A